MEFEWKSSRSGKVFSSHSSRGIGDLVFGVCTLKVSYCLRARAFSACLRPVIVEGAPELSHGLGGPRTDLGQLPCLSAMWPHLSWSICGWLSFSQA